MCDSTVVLPAISENMAAEIEGKANILLATELVAMLGEASNSDQNQLESIQSKLEDSSGESNKRRGGDVEPGFEDQNELTFSSKIATAPIDILPDELMENIFGRLSPYSDLDSVKLVCRHWNRIALKVVSRLQNGFEKSFHDGSLRCEAISTVYNDSNRAVGAWISERFGHMCCYYDRAMYVIGGTTHTPTTFNDMWKFDLSTRTWERCIASGKYPTPKALASFVQYKDNFVLFGGWAHPPPYPLMQPWRIFDELHIYNITSQRWSQVITTSSPDPSAGHSASVHGDLMIVFGGRNFNQGEQSFPLSNCTWIFNFLTGEWYAVSATNEPPLPRYGQTQIAMDDSHALIIGGCGGPNQIFSDIWLLQIESKGRRYFGTWTKMKNRNPKVPVPHDFHYSGCKVGETVVFCDRSSPISPFLAFLHFDNSCPPGNHPNANLVHNPQNQLENLVFEPSRSRAYFHSRCSSGLRQQTAATMPVYSLNVSKVLTERSIEWTKEPEPVKFSRPKERLLYSMVAGRAELIIFGGFYKDPNGMSCRVSNDVFVLKTIHKNY